MTHETTGPADQLAMAKALVSALESRDNKNADRLFNELLAERDSSLFMEIGRLTRQLHESIRSFSLDSRIAELTAKDIPDAKERLRYVITMTEQAANTTLEAVEETLPVAERLSNNCDELAVRWNRFLHREMPYEEFKGLSHQLGQHFTNSQADLAIIQGKLNDVLMAQGFQDLTGQIIRKVIDLVQDMEASLVELIRISGQRYHAVEKEEEPVPTIYAEGPVVPGVDDRQGNTVNSQDDVDDLLSSLGF